MSDIDEDFVDPTGVIMGSAEKINSDQKDYGWKTENRSRK